MVRQPTNRVSRSQQYEAQAKPWVLPVPAEAQRATVYQSDSGDWVMVTGTSNVVTRSSISSPSVVRAWREAGGQCDEHFGWVPNEVVIRGCEATLAEALAAGELRIVSDGSYSDRWVKWPSNC